MGFHPVGLSRPGCTSANIDRCVGCFLKNDGGYAGRELVVFDIADKYAGYIRYEILHGVQRFRFGKANEAD